MDAQTLQVEPLRLPHGSVLSGMEIRVPGVQVASGTVVDSGPKGGVIRVDRVPRAFASGSYFDLVSGEEAPVLAARLLTGTPLGGDLPPIRMRLATTRATNALLERKGSRIALFVTAGFGDLLRIGDQRRPELFTLRIEKPAPLYARVVEVPERLSADGSVVRRLDIGAVRDLACSLADDGISTAAVSLLHAYRNPIHEEVVGQLLADAGFSRVSLSSTLAPAIHYLHRTTTTVANAYLAETLTGYVDRVEASLSPPQDRNRTLRLMTSAGGLVGAREFHPKDALLSGPAAGVVGAAAAGRDAGFDRIIAFDMGGTSTDVSRFDVDFDYSWRHRVGDVELLAPALAIETVAAGGGSICAWKSGALTVGPESAGASPGPACYGAGGPLTLTDCNLLLGRIDPERFGVPLRRDLADAALRSLQASIAADTGETPPREALLAGLIDIADERMAEAIRSISVRKGYDPADYALVPFGGAGAQHGCGVARRLGMTRQVAPLDGGLLSATGLARARVERIAEKQILREIGDDPRWVERELVELERRALAALHLEGVAADVARVRRRIANLRLAGQETTIAVESTADTPLTDAFRTAYRQTYGHDPERRPIEVESLRLIADGPGGTDFGDRRSPSTSPAQAEWTETATPSGTARVWIAGSWRDVPRHDRESLGPGAALAGPCIVTDAHTSVVLEDGWSGRVHPSGAILLEYAAAGDQSASLDANAALPDAVRDQLFTSRFESLVDEMGEQLRRTAISTNVKERLDFSCALLNAHGELVANAPHIPVHLGALGLCVRAVASALEMGPGDVVATNHPAFGGSHLPDVTVITPVHTGAGTLVGYVANRAHHAEIGGTRPGSMPPDARTLAEEGVVIPPLRLVSAGRAEWREITELLTASRFPSRSPNDNLADLRAQVAANHRGAELLRRMADEHGQDVVRDQMDALAARAERGARAALAQLGPRTLEAAEHLDDGSTLAVRITIDDAGTTEFDFGGTSGVHAGNLNATPAIVHSAVLYVLRLLIDEPLPLNEGILRPVRLRLPVCLLAPDFGGDADRSPAVVGGNTEVSQRLVDTLVKALSLAACSQGTMNNVLWGNDPFGYYETIAGGAGATDGYPGADAVHTHMTNTRITDPEIVELRYPVRVERFAVRPGSGGQGRYRGGDGTVREITFLAPVALSVLTQHRREQPYGMAGGLPGAVGAQSIVRATGDSQRLDPIDGADARPGDRLIIETPGGGGWGKPEE